MKSRLIKFVPVFILFITLLPLQELLSQEKPMRIGVKGGWNYAFTNVEVAYGEVKGRNGLNIGGVFEYWVSGLFAIHTSVLYNMKGNKWEREFTTDTREYSWAFDYLSIPILAKFAFGNQVKFYLVVGPEFSFLLSAKENRDGIGWSDPGETDFKEYMSSFEFAGIFGFGVDIQLDPVVLFIDVRGSLGFTDVYKETPPISIEEGSVINLVPSASIGVLYPFGN